MCVVWSRCVLVVGVVLSAGSAKGQPPPEPRGYVAVHYRVDAALQDCPSEAQFRALVARRLGYEPHRPGADTVVEVTAEPDGAGLGANVTWTRLAQPLGHRQIQEPTRASWALAATIQHASQTVSLNETPPPVIPEPMLTDSLSVVWLTPASVSVSPARVSVPPSSAKAPVASGRSQSAFVPPAAAELNMLKPAQRAVRQGDYSAALKAIARHRRRSPRGVLAEEREALRVKALRGLGRTAEARGAADSFRRSFPHSALSDTVTAPGASQE